MQSPLKRMQFMINDEYAFINSDQINDDDRAQLVNMLEAYFKTEHDPEQMQIGKKAHAWLKTQIPECGVMIKKGNEVIGATLVLPCTLSLMKNFIQGQLNEAQLAEEIRMENIHYQTMEAIYLCSAFVASKHRRKNLAITALLKSIRAITPKGKKLPIFYWAHSLSGQKISEKLAIILGVDVFCKPHV